MRNKYEFLQDIAQTQMAAMSVPFADDDGFCQFADPEEIAKLAVAYAKALLKELESDTH